MPGHNYWLDFGSSGEFVGGSRDFASKIKLFPPFPAEFLRHAGVACQAPHLEKHDRLVEKLAGTVLAGYEDLPATAEECTSLLRHLVSKGMSVGRARQIVMAGLARGCIRYSQTVF
jgi:hypothetical protein